MMIDKKDNMYFNGPIEKETFWDIIQHITYQINIDKIAWTLHLNKKEPNITE